MIAHLEAMNNADTVALTINNTYVGSGGQVSIGTAAITVGPLLKCFRFQTEDIKAALENYGVELEA